MYFDAWKPLQTQTDNLVPFTNCYFFFCSDVKENDGNFNTVADEILFNPFFLHKKNDTDFRFQFDNNYIK